MLRIKYHFIALCAIKMFLCTHNIIHKFQINMIEIIRKILIIHGDKEGAADNDLIESIVRNMPGGTYSKTIRYIDANYSVIL